MDKRVILGAVLIGALASLAGCNSQTLDTTVTKITEDLTESTTAVSEDIAGTETETTTVVEETTVMAEQNATVYEMNAFSTEDTTQVAMEDFSAICGDWYVDGDTTAEHLHINADGSFVDYDESANTVCSGKVCYESDEMDGTTLSCYNLYTAEGDFFKGFVDDGSIRYTDLYADNGGKLHYILTA